MNAARFPKTRPTFWLAIDPETLEPLTYRTEDEAFAGWRDFPALDFYRVDPDGHHSLLNDDFADRELSECWEASAMRRHEDGLGRAWRYL